MRHRNVLQSAKAAFVAVVLATLGATQALAVDTKNYPGAMCVPWGANQTPGYSFSAIYNPSSAWLHLDCPAVKDASSINSGWVRAIDRNFNSNVWCELVNIGLYTFGTRYATSGGTSEGDQVLNFSGLSSDSQARYYYSCHIPPAYFGNQSAVVSYMVREND